MVGPMKKRIFLADLTHTGRGTHAPTFPLGMSYVASYAKKNLDEDFEIRIFRFPNDLTKAIVEESPQFLCFSNYSWNFELSYKISALAKQRDPRIIVVFGGPNFPVLPAERAEFLKERSMIDFYFQNEGEIGFTELVKKLQKFNFDVAAFKEAKEVVTNGVYLMGSDLMEGPFQRIQDPNVIPSPYLTGLLDPFFDLPLSPMIESTRGCPFSCAFCADGLISKSMIHRFNPERTKEELHYIAERVKNVDELIITDLNFGMYKEDVLFAENIAEIQRRYNWPVIIGASPGKNNKAQVIQVINILRGSLMVGAAIQSSDPEVLKNIKRSNISLEAYRSFMEYSNGLSKDSNTFTDIILALPGDTKQKHFQSLRYGIENGANAMKMFQAILLSGTEMATKDMRQKYQYLSKFRIIPGGTGTYQFGDQLFSVAEVEEIIVGSKDMLFEDYVSCRVMNLVVETYFNNALFNEVFTSLQAMGASPFDCLLYIHAHPELYTPTMRNILAKFVEATSKDLYDSYEEAIECTSRPEMVQKYITGELGVNELLVYRAELYKEMEDIALVLKLAVKGFLTQQQLLDGHVKLFFDELIEYTVCRKKTFYNSEEVLERPFAFDFKLLEQSRFMVDPRTVMPAPSSVHIRFYHDPQQQSHIKHALGLYTNTPSGLGRLIQKSNMKKMYRNVDYNVDYNVNYSGREIPVLV